MNKTIVEKKIDFRILLIYLLISFAIIVIFSGFDYLAHTLSEEYAVPSRYFTNKIIYGTIFGFFVLWIFRKKGIVAKSLIFSGIVSVLLQVRYFLEGYPLDFVLEFLVIHFLILVAVSLIFFRIFDKRLSFK